MTTKFAVRLKKNDGSIGFYDTFESALNCARTYKEKHPYVEIKFICMEECLAVEDYTLIDGYLSKTVWTAQDDVEA